MKLREAIQDVCLRKPTPAPFFVPVHQETLTKQHLAQVRVKALLGLSPRARESLIESNPISQKGLRDVKVALRNFADSFSTTFATARAPQPHPRQRDYLDSGSSQFKAVYDENSTVRFMGWDLNEGMREQQQKLADTLNSLTPVQAEAMGVDEPGALSEFMKNQFKLRRQKKLDITNSIDQDLKEMKELPPPEPKDQ